jgi:hypothetical protein
MHRKYCVEIQKILCRDSWLKIENLQGQVISPPGLRKNALLIGKSGFKVHSVH